MVILRGGLFYSFFQVQNQYHEGEVHLKPRQEILIFKWIEVQHFLSTLS